MPKMRISVLEATDLTKELIRGLKERIGSNFNRDPGIIDLDLKVKGIPFLTLNIN